MGTKKPCMHTLQATATLRLLIENEADRMPHKSRTLESVEKVPAMVLPSTFQWSDQMQEINDVNKSFNIQPISSNGLSNIRCTSFLEYAPKVRGDTFARCGQCDTYKRLKSACTPQSRAREKWAYILQTHIVGQKAHRGLYYANRHI